MERKFFSRVLTRNFYFYVFKVKKSIFAFDVVTFQIHSHRLKILKAARYGHAGGEVRAR
jgi:hypothetical protein